MATKMVVLLDFEKIVADINPEMNRKLTTIPTANVDIMEIRKTKTILIAEDSKMLRDLLISTLHVAGYINTISTENGKMAWDTLEQMAANTPTIQENLHLIITDIEMPQMDGHHLIKRIKDHEQLKALPVIIFSSLINEEMRRKGEALGAAAQVTKPEITQLIDLIDKKIL